MGKQKTGRNGFTLIEVIVVLTLTVLVLGLTTVYLAGFLPSAQLNATGREMSALIRHARSLARMQRETRTVVIDLDNRTYGLGEQIIKRIPSPIQVRIIDPVSGEIGQGKYPLVFHATGGMAGGTIVLSGGKKKLLLNLDPLTGAVLTKGG